MNLETAPTTDHRSSDNCPNCGPLGRLIRHDPPACLTCGHGMQDIGVEIIDEDDEK